MKKAWCVLIDGPINKEFCENNCPLIDECGKSEKDEIWWITKELMGSRSIGYQPTDIKENEDRDVKEILDELTGRRGSREFELKSEAARSMGHVYMSEEKESKNPKQILIDWINNVKESAIRARNCIDNGSPDDAEEYIWDILGQCKAMEVVLNNSDSC